MVWNVSSGQLLHQFKGPSTGVMQLAFDPQGRELAGACCGDMSRSIVGEVRIWDLAGKEPMRQLNGGACVAYSPNGEWMATAGEDYHYGVVCLWKAASRDRVKTITGHTGIVTCVAFDPAGSRLVTGCQDSIVRVFSIPDGKLLTKCMGASGTVYGVAVSPDGKRIVSGGSDGVVTVWDPASGREVLSLRGHSGPVYAVSFTQDGDRIISCGSRETLIWDATTVTRPALEDVYGPKKQGPGVRVKPAS
jgi:WD40 repeat protein